MLKNGRYVPKASALGSVRALAAVRSGGHRSLEAAEADALLVALRDEATWYQMLMRSARVMALVSATHRKLLHLTSSWLNMYLPHCLSKVNRVSFGLLTDAECAEALNENARVPKTRLKLAVPFTGLDTPSRASEFAHADCVIGLSILAYRYSGLRNSDFRDLFDVLTASFRAQVGPPRRRAASVMYEEWVHAASGTIRGVDAPAGAGDEDFDVEAYEARDCVQLRHLQKSNREQMSKLYRLLKQQPATIHHYLSALIFPEFTKQQAEAQRQRPGRRRRHADRLAHRLLRHAERPAAEGAGSCDYARGDDGNCIATVLDPDVMSYELLRDHWTVEGILDRIATGRDPQVHALIDTGALITGYSNLQVAKELFRRGLGWCDGCVYLDDEDRKMVLVRATGRSVAAEQCGVPLERRFAFYDHTHCTGMDIKHSTVLAVLTLGKDMVFRDYVQGAFRMRGIGQGQKIRVMVIQEVRELIQRELGFAGDPAASRSA